MDCVAERGSPLGAAFLKRAQQFKRVRVGFHRAPVSLIDLDRPNQTPPLLHWLLPQIRLKTGTLPSAVISVVSVACLGVPKPRSRIALQAASAALSLDECIKDAS